MAQLRRLRELFDAQERVFTTVPGLVDYVKQLGPSRGSTCAIRMRLFRGSNFTTDQFSGTHLEFIDAESASVFDDTRNILMAIPLSQARSEIARLTVWERADLTCFTPGVVYDIRHVFNLNLYDNMSQGSATRVYAEGRIEVELSCGDNDESPQKGKGSTTAATDATTTDEGAENTTAIPVPTTVPHGDADNHTASKRKRADG